MLLTIADFWNQCFPCELPTLHPVPWPVLFTPLRKEPASVKAVGAIREASCVGCWKPVTIVVGVFCTALYHESVNTVMSNLFITTDYWTRTQKHGSSYTWICLVKKGSWGSDSVTHGMCRYLKSLLPPVARHCWQSWLNDCVGCQVTCPLDVDSYRGKIWPLSQIAYGICYRWKQKSSLRVPSVKSSNLENKLSQTNDLYWIWFWFPSQGQSWRHEKCPCFLRLYLLSGCGPGWNVGGSGHPRRP